MLKFGPDFVLRFSFSSRKSTRIPARVAADFYMGSQEGRLCCTDAMLLLCCCHAVAMRFVVTKPNQFRVDVHSGSIVLLKLYMDLQKLSFEFVFCTLPNKTKLKFYLDSLIGLMSLIKFEDTMPWACCAFGNVSTLRLSEIFF